MPIKAGIVRYLKMSWWEMEQENVRKLEEHIPTYKKWSADKKNIVMSIFGAEFYAKLGTPGCGFCTKYGSYRCPKISLRKAFGMGAEHFKVQLLAVEDDEDEQRSEALLSYRLYEFVRPQVISALRIFTPDERKLLIDVFDHDDEYMRMVMHVLRTL